MDRPAPSTAIDPELLEQAARLRLDVGAMSEAQLRLQLQKIDPAGAAARARRWAEENAEAIKDHNDRIRRRGLISEHFRKW
jgi:antitoxin CcdA